MSVLVASFLMLYALSLPPASKGFWVYINISGLKPYGDGLQLHTSDEQLHRAFQSSHIPRELRR